MKIALVILHADPAKGGAERYTYDLAAALARTGHEVTLIASTLGPRPPGVSCVELKERGLTRLSRYQHFLDDLDQHLTTTKYDIVHAMLPVRNCDVYHPHAGVAADAIVTGHLKHAGAIKRTLAEVANRINIKRKAFAKVEQQLLNHKTPPVVLCLSEYVKQTVRAHYPNLSEVSLATLFNAVDLQKYDPAARPEARGAIRAQFGLAESAPVALIVAQDFQRKGLAEAITALANIQPTPLSLLVVGKDDPTRYARLAAELKISDRILFAGPTTDVYAYYAAADFFVLPTRHDPCSLVVLEALAMGLPVISTKQNGACEIMETATHGFVLENADDTAGLISAMRQLCDNAIRAKMRQACLTLRPRLAYSTHLQTLLAIYARCK